jgi:hypothetical protein
MITACCCLFLILSFTSFVHGEGIVERHHQLLWRRRFPRSIPVTTAIPAFDHVTAETRVEASPRSLLSSLRAAAAEKQESSPTKDARGLSVLHSDQYPHPNHNHHNLLNHFNPFQESNNNNNQQASSFDYPKDRPDIPVIVSEALTNGNNRIAGSLVDRAVVRAPWNVLTAKLFRLVAVFFLESYLVQLFGVSLPID